MQGLLEVSVVTIFLNGVRSDDTLQVIVFEESLHGKIAERHAAAPEAVELEGAGQQAIQLLINTRNHNPVHTYTIPR